MTWVPFTQIFCPWKLFEMPCAHRSMNWGQMRGLKGTGLLRRKRQLPISAALNAVHTMKNSTCKRAYTKSLYSYTNHLCRVDRKLRKLLIKDVKVPITLLTPYLKPSAELCEAFHTRMKVAQHLLSPCQLLPQLSFSFRRAGGCRKCFGGKQTSHSWAELTRLFCWCFCCASSSTSSQHVLVLVLNSLKALNPCKLP